jgi:hypothetical protein
LVVQIISVWGPIAIPILIFLGVAKLSHQSLAGLVTHILREAREFAKAKHNPLSLNFLGGIVIAAIIAFVTIHSSAIETIQLFRTVPTEGGGNLLPAYLFMLGIYFLVCVKLTSGRSPP